MATGRRRPNPNAASSTSTSSNALLTSTSKASTSVSAPVSSAATTHTASSTVSSKSVASRSNTKSAASSGTTTVANPGTSQLPSKEQNVFKSVVRLYETKQFKKAVKTADMILRKYPDHGETLAMKGLTLNALERKEEATELVRKGLRMDMKSHICWHVYGLLYRSERDYREAAKAYLNALRIDKDNQQILRDLALLQVQIRDYDGLEDTRRRLLTVRPSQRNNWIGFALSYHLLGNHATAVSVLDTYLKTLSQSSSASDGEPKHLPEERYETSELLLYKTMVLEESGCYSEALTHLDEVADKLVDRCAVNETKARLHAALGDYEKSMEILQNLVRVNPDNHFYHHALHVCAIRMHRREDGQVVDETNGRGMLPLSWPAPSLDRIRNLQYPDDVDRVLDICDKLSDQYPFSRTARRIALDVLPDGQHTRFVNRVDVYVRPFLRKGIPSLFSDVKPLYQHASKAAAFGALFENYLQHLNKSDGRQLPVPLSGESSEKQDEEPPCTLLWVLHFLAQHYDRMGDFEKAMRTIERAILHTPTAIECYVVKARVAKHFGDYKGAVTILNEARKLDLADRYLNTKCCKYALQADMIGEAEAWVALFTRDGDSGGAQALYDMQCMWFELGAAESHLRRGQFALALKKFMAVDRHFADMIEDQFDFHSYCLRKVTLRSYVRLIRYEDRIRRHPSYSRAAGGLLNCLLTLMDLSEKERLVLVGEHADIQGYADMTDAQRRKAVSKRKKQLAKQQHQHNANGVAEKDGAASANESKGKVAVAGWMESDTSGVEHVKTLLNTGNGKQTGVLREAVRIVSEMQASLGNEVRTHEFAFKVALQRRKYLEALRSVRKAVALDCEDVRTAMMCIRLEVEVKKIVQSSSSSVVKKVFDGEGNVLDGLSVEDFLQQFIQRNSKNATKVVGVGRIRLWLAGQRVDGYELAKVCAGVVQTIENAKTEGSAGETISPKFCRNFVEELRMDRVPVNVVGNVRACLKRKFPKASCFEPC